MRKPERPRPHRDRARDVTEGDEAERLAHQPRLIERRPALGPPSFAHHAVLHHQRAGMTPATASCAWSATSSMNVSGTLVTGMPLGGRRRHVHLVRPDRAERDQLAALEPVDHALGEFAALGIDRIGVVGRVDERIFRGCVDLDDLEAESVRAPRFQTRSRQPATAKLVPLGVTTLN